MDILYIMKLMHARDYVHAKATQNQNFGTLAKTAELCNMCHQQ